MSASAFSLSVAIPSDGFAVIEGEPVIGGLHAADVRHFFCCHCMTWLFTRTSGLDQFVNIRPTMLDDPAWFSPFIETWTSEKLPWAATPAVHNYEQFPPFEAYADLVGEYAARRSGASSLALDLAAFEQRPHPEEPRAARRGRNFMPQPLKQRTSEGEERSAPKDAQQT